MKEKDRSTTRLALYSWALYDWAGQSYATIVQTFIFAAYFTRRVAENETVGTTQWGNIIAATGVIVALGGPVLGAMADRLGRRKPWLAAFTLICVLAMALMWFVTPGPDSLLPALALVAVGTIASEFSMIFYNSMLPELVERKRMGRWSGLGWSAGYAGGLVCLSVALLAFVSTENPWFELSRDTARHVRATFVLAAGWYLIFALPLFLFTPDSQSTGSTFGEAARSGLRQLADSIRHIGNYANILKFLIARMIYIDGLATLFAFGGVYAAGTFGMNEQQVLLFGISMNVTAGIGAASFSFIDDRIGSKSTILIALCGLIASGSALLFTGTQTTFWIFGQILGLFVGPVQASSRSFLGRAAPQRLRSQIFGLYALSGKATAFLGPFLVGWLTYVSGSQRIGMGVIIVLFLLGALMMVFVSSPAEDD